MRMLGLCLLLLLAASTARAQHLARVAISDGRRTNGVVRITALAGLRDLRRCLGAGEYALVVRLDIDAGGRVTNAAAWGTGLGARGPACIEAAAGRWTFPASPEPTRAHLYIGGAESEPAEAPAPRAPEDEQPARQAPAPREPPAEETAPEPASRVEGTAGVRIPAAMADGALEVEAVTARVQRALARVSACFSHAQGSIAVRLAVARDGTVTSGAIARTSFPDAAVGECALHALVAVRFPASRGTTRVDLTLAL